MNFNQSEKYVLAILACGMLQAGYKEGALSRTQFESYLQEAFAKLGTTGAIITMKLDVNPFLTIKLMDSTKKDFVKTFLYDTLQKVPNCETAVYYFASTLEQSEL